MRNTLVAVGVVGFLLLLGSAGAFDAAALPFEQALGRCLLGLCLLLGSFLSVRALDRAALARRRVRLLRRRVPVQPQYGRSAA